MALNLDNPMTEDLKIEHLASRFDDCLDPRIGYEIMVGPDKFALLPVASDQAAEIGEEVSLDSMGPMRRGRVIRVLRGYQHDYVDSAVIEEDEVSYEVLERHYIQDGGVSEQTFRVLKTYS